MVHSFVAVRLLQLREVFVALVWMHAESAESNKRRSNKPCTEVLSESEWKVLWLAQERTRPPSEVPTMRWAYETLGKLGGWINGQRTGRVGLDYRSGTIPTSPCRNYLLTHRSDQKTE